MKTFEYLKSQSLDTALQHSAGIDANQKADVRYIAGGTTLVDLMKLNVETPGKLIDISEMPLDKIEVTTNGGLKIGALVRNSALANHPIVRTQYQVLSEAILAGASTQLRNRATTGGNLLQKTRCLYFRDTAFACNKREPGSGCPAIEGHHRNLAILGTSDHCVANNPSDMNVAMMALDARIEIQNKDGSRVVPITEFYALPGNTPHIENVLKPGDLITYVHIDPLPAGAQSSYLKLRDRASYEFALASCAIITQMNAGIITSLKVAMGGIGAIPWRAKEVEDLLKGKPPKTELFEASADALLRNARPLKENEFKIELAKRCLVHSLTVATAENFRSIEHG